MPRRIAVSDIHGCIQTFQTLLQRLEVQPEDELFLLGDFIDRGPGSKQVIDLVWDLADRGVKTHCLRGNHEQMLLDAVEVAHQHRMWQFNGGKETMQSFGVDRIEGIPDRYLEWMNALPLYLESPGYLMVHAGIDFRSEAPLEDEAALLWLRDWYDRIDRDWLGDRIVIHGHTPRPSPLIRRQIKRVELIPALNVDSGCVFTMKGMGCLCAFDLDARTYFFQPNVEGGRNR